MKIYYQTNDPYIDAEAESKGYRLDVFVEAYGKLFNLAVYDTVRLIQDFETEYNLNRYFVTSANLVLVKTLTTAEIIKTIEGLFQNGFFEKIKPTDSVSIEHLHQFY